MPWRDATPEDGEEAHRAGCRIWTGYTDRHGVPVVRTKTSNTTGARWLWTREYGPVPEGKVLGSLCGTRLCVHYAHREPMTREELAHRSGVRALTPTQRERALRLASSGMSKRGIAQRMNVDETTIRRVVLQERDGAETEERT